MSQLTFPVIARWPFKSPLYISTMMTINADSHPLLETFHKPADEKRIIVIPLPERYDNWLQASAKVSRNFLQVRESK